MGFSDLEKLEKKMQVKLIWNADVEAVTHGT